MEKLVKEKEEVVKKANIPMDVVPLAAVPMTIVSNFGTAETICTTEGAKQLVEAVQNLSIQTQEINKLQDQLKTLQHMKAVADNSHAVKLHWARDQIEVLQKEVKDSYLGNTLGLVKEIIWEEIIESIKYIWPYIRIFFYQKDLLEKAQEAIETISNQLEDKLEIATDIIKFLNSKDSYEFQELGIDDRTTAILEVKKFITNKNLILQLEEKCSNVNVIVQHFFSRLEPLTNKGFPSIFVINDNLMPIEDYVRKLTEVKTSATIVSNIKGTTTPRLVLNALQDTFFILYEIKHIFL